MLKLSTVLGRVMTVAMRMLTSSLVRELWHGLDDTTVLGIAFPPLQR